MGAYLRPDNGLGQDQESLIRRGSKKKAKIKKLQMAEGNIHSVPPLSLSEFKNFCAERGSFQTDVPIDHFS